jgi:hypothetical protein
MHSSTVELGGMFKDVWPLFCNGRLEAPVAKRQSAPPWNKQYLTITLKRRPFSPTLPRM